MTQYIMHIESIDLTRIALSQWAYLVGHVLDKLGVSYLHEFGTLCQWLKYRTL